MKKIIFFCLFFLVSCKPSESTQTNTSIESLRSFSEQEEKDFEGEIDAISYFEKSPNLLADLTDCHLSKDNGYLQKNNWEEFNYFISQATAQKKCPLFGIFKIKRTPTNDKWESNTGFAVLNTAAAKTAVVSSFFFKWSGEKKDQTTIHGEGFWFSNKNGKVNITLDQTSTRLQLSFIYQKFKVVIKAERAGNEVIITKGPDRITPASFNHISRLGLILENLPAL